VHFGQNPGHLFAFVWPQAHSDDSQRSRWFIYEWLKKVASCAGKRHGFIVVDHVVRMTLPKELSAENVRRAQAGDEGARNVILRRLESILRGYFIRRIGRQTVVDDLVQNAMLRVHKGIKDVKEPAGFMAFAMKAALFELQDLYRGRYRAKEHLYDPESPPDVAPTEPTPESKVDLDWAIGHLTPHARRILQLREYGFRYAEIAEKLNTTEAAVKMQVKRALDRLRKLLEDKQEEY
jgi:RNA polymerase sigma-70 factor (ECF subfamily)